MKAKALTAYPINAFTGREFVRYEWRQIPAGCEAEAERLEAAGLLELKRGGDLTPPAGFPGGDKLPVNISSDSVKIEPPPTLGTDLDSLTIIQLKDMAKERGIVVGRKSKAELIDALRDD